MGGDQMQDLDASDSSPAELESSELQELSASMTGEKINECKQLFMLYSIESLT